MKNFRFYPWQRHCLKLLFLYCKRWITYQKIGKGLPRVVGSSPLKRKESRDGAPAMAQSICQGEKRGSVTPLGQGMRHDLPQDHPPPPWGGDYGGHGLEAKPGSPRAEFRTCTRLQQGIRSSYTGKGLLQPRKLPGQFYLDWVLHIF